ncbi:S8 family serine peptidase [Planosporangium sp. 12N6]
MFAASVGLVAAPLAAIGPATASPADTGPSTAVVVRYDGATPDAAARAVTRTGGRVDRLLTSVGVLTARVPGAALTALRRAPGVRAVTADGTVRLTADQWGSDQATKGRAGWGAGNANGNQGNGNQGNGNQGNANQGNANQGNGNQGNANQGGASGIAAAVDAPAVWAKSDATGRKVTGQGIGVALIDSGIAPVTGLSDPTKVINGPDLSFEAPLPGLRHLDTFGHGTHMAGIIAGRDPGLRDDQLGDGRSFVGVAPGANLVNLKVAAADGAVDVSQVIAAIDWVVTHRSDPGLNIRVLNLSFGTDSAQDPRLDPLSYAVEAAWRNGIVVVVSAGNDGATATRLSMPAVNPYVIAVGAADDNGTAKLSDDVVAEFSSRGNSTRHPDLVAPGSSVVSLRDPGSYIDVTYPTGLVPGDTTGRYFRGSGTSQAAAVVSGAVALLLQQRPTLTPDQVKRLLTSTASAMPAADPVARGAGQLNLAGASTVIGNAGNGNSGYGPAATQSFAPATGLGSLELSRGTSHVADPDTGVVLTGEQDIMGQPWTPATWTVAARAGLAWTAGTWNGSVWSGDGFSGTPGAAMTWRDVDWAGRTWAGRTWADAVWSDAVWDGRTWAGRTWAGRTWAGRTWASGSWSASP